MYRKTIISCIIAFALLFFVWGNGGSTAKLESPTLPPIAIEIEEVEEAEEVVPVYDVALSPELQEYTYRQCQLRDLSFEMVLAMMKTESNFNTKLISSTKDYGLMQLNKQNHAWFGEVLNIDKFDPLNPFHNIQAGTWFLSYIRKYWLEHDISDEQLFSLMLLSYNRGITGAKRYIQKYGWENSYITKVSNYKEQIERGLER